MDKKEERSMTVLAKPRDRGFAIAKEMTTQFLEDSKKNIITKDFARKCKESASLFVKMDFSRKR